MATQPSISPYYYYSLAKMQDFESESSSASSGNAFRGQRGYRRTQASHSPGTEMPIYNVSRIHTPSSAMGMTPREGFSGYESLEGRSPDVAPRASDMKGLHRGEDDDEDDGRRLSSMDPRRFAKTHSSFKIDSQPNGQVSSTAVISLRAGRSPTTASTSTITVATSTTVKPGSKRSRYLREADRRSIIRRIDNGEKQAALAKEFGVTRAAICHINKNRVEILTRSARADVSSSARHPKRGMYTTSKSSLFRHPDLVDEQNEHPMVYQVRSHALSMLLTNMRSKDTDSRRFRHYADRAFRILVEEAIACVPTRATEIVTPNDFLCQGIVPDREPCAIGVSETGFPLLEAFRCIQPESPTGFITLEEGHDHGYDSEGQEFSSISLRKICAPPNLRSYNLFVLEATCASGRGAATAIQSLLDLGAQEDAIYFVTLVTSAYAVAELCSRFSNVHLVVGAIDPETTREFVICPGLGNFHERYLNATVLRHSASGVNIDL
ncbi:hypothetical protein Poli38472_005641 [Pythium oligandrum]|uniref:HTH psq-type domain-containing protein n=1 Tax=Pythium oligandrum TaxID=41045 RepID=A0A8K1CID3_PYTOL|nr:hypothetical protein Poli38472_005641 [Pythium oligandrum]|eukprot:TMW63023.1 hypothetical protein Poli38472_005641 [Pythium oligandrum]